MCVFVHLKLFPCLLSGCETDWSGKTKSEDEEPGRRTQGDRLGAKPMQMGSETELMVIESRCEL